MRMRGTFPSSCLFKTFSVVLFCDLMILDVCRIIKIRICSNTINRPFYQLVYYFLSVNGSLLLVKDMFILRHTCQIV